MTKKKNKKKTEIVKEAIIEEMEVSEVLRSNYMPYVMAVIVSRAIPSIDGLKPSQRKLLYTMHEMGLGKKGAARKKSSTIVGHAMTYNPHGDQSMYETMVRLTESNGTLLHPYIDSKGSWGHRYSDDQPAAHRYTEARLSPIAEELFKGIDDNYTEFKPNFDNTKIEPVLLPVTFPNILVNPNMGIAVGMASNIPSFNLVEVCDATIALINDKSVDTFKFIKAPDFSTGGEVVLKDNARDILNKGRGSFTLKAKYRIDEKQRVIEVYEIPYTTTSNQIIDQIKRAVKSDKMREVSDVRDESDKNGLKIAIDYKTTADVDVLIGKLFKFTKMEDSFACNFNLLINEKPQVLGVADILLEWIEWRKISLKRGLSTKVSNMEKELHLMKGLEKIVLDIDKAIKIIRETPKSKDINANLMKGFDIDEEQASHVSRMMLRNINEESINERLKSIKKLEREVKSLKNTIKSDKKLGNLIIKDLERIKEQYGKDRQTEIIDEEEHQETSITQDELTEDYNLKIVITNEGYIKKLALTSLRSNPELKLKEDDFIIKEFETSNSKGEIIVLTNKQNAHKIFIDELEDNKPSEFGHYVDNLCDMEDGEEVLFIHPTDDYSGEFVVGYSNGKATRMPLDLFETKTRRKTLKNSLYDGSDVIGIEYITKPTNIIMISNETRGIMFDSDLVSLRKTRDSQGIQVLRLKKEEYATKMATEDKATIKSLDRYKKDKIPAAGVSSRNDLI